jgi:hypothetical protein
VTPCPAATSGGLAVETINARIEDYLARGEQFDLVVLANVHSAPAERGKLLRCRGDQWSSFLEKAGEFAVRLPGPDTGCVSEQRHVGAPPLEFCRSVGTGNEEGQ